MRQSYNFAPGYTGLVYRAATTTAGAGSHGENEQSDATTNAPMSGATSAGGHSQETSCKDIAKNDRPKYVLQAMKWGVYIWNFYVNSASCYSKPYVGI